MAQHKWIVLIGLYLKHSCDLINGGKCWFDQFLVFCGGATWIDTFCLCWLFGGTYTILVYIQKPEVLQCRCTSNRCFLQIWLSSKILPSLWKFLLQYWCCRVGPFVYLFVHTEGIPSPCSSRRNTLDCCNLEIWKPFKLPVFTTGVVVLVNYRTVVLTTCIYLLNIVFAINAKSEVVLWTYNTILYQVNTEGCSYSPLVNFI